MSDEQQDVDGIATPEPKRRGRPPSSVTVVNRSDPSGFDVETIIKRRLSGEPFGTRQATVPIRDAARWATMEANSLADRNMHYRMVHEYGWVPVTASDLDGGITPESIGWSVGADGVLCRGPQMDSKLYKQPMAVRRQIASAKAAANMKGMGSARSVKAAISESIGAQMGAEAGDFAESSITVTGADRTGAL
jgi:hypothetical protein